MATAAAKQAAQRISPASESLVEPPSPGLDEKHNDEPPSALPEPPALPVVAGGASNLQAEDSTASSETDTDSASEGESTPATPAPRKWRRVMPPSKKKVAPPRKEARKKKHVAAPEPDTLAFSDESDLDVDFVEPVDRKEGQAEGKETWKEGGVLNFVPPLPMDGSRPRDLPPTTQRHRTPWRFLQLFLPLTFWDNVCKFTNQYYSYCFARAALGGADELQEPDVIVEEIIVFHAIVIGMSLVTMPNRRWHWREAEAVADDGMIPAGKAGHFMSRNRFEHIRRYLHFQDPATKRAATDPNFDKLQSLRMVVKTLSDNFKRYFLPGQCLVVDESMAPSKARCPWTVKIIGKPHSTGVKIWCLNDSKTAYCYGFNIYVGVEKNHPPSGHGSGYDVVMRLVNQLERVGHIVLTDRYFSSPQLARDLREKGHHLVGTIKANRKGLPAGFAFTKSKSGKQRGELGFSVSGDGLVLAKWWDSSAVLVLSTGVHGTAIGEVSRRVKGSGRAKTVVPCPRSIIAFNEDMGGVDRFDQLKLGKTGIETSVVVSKWPTKLWLSLFSMATVNAYVVYKAANPQESYTDFMWDLQADMLRSTARARAGVAVTQKAWLMFPPALQGKPPGLPDHPPGRILIRGNRRSQHWHQRCWRC